MKNPTDFRTPLARVRHLGSAKEGTAHWWGMRLSSLALVPLCLYLLAGLMCLMAAPYAEVIAWVAKPHNAVMLGLLIVVMFHHMAHGLQVIAEDYLHHEGVKMAALITIKFLSFAAAALGLFAVLKIAFGA